MASDIRIQDIVALLKPSFRNNETGCPLLLQRGQIGNVVMIYHSRTFEVKFSGRDGHSYVLLSIEGNKLMLPCDPLEYAVA
jgi:hypothetical protein